MLHRPPVLLEFFFVYSYILSVQFINVQVEVTTLPVFNLHFIVYRMKVMCMIVISGAEEGGGGVCYPN